MRKKKAFHYPWRYNNIFHVLVDGADYFSAMLNEIKNAKSSVLFETYLFQSGDIADKFIHELCCARKRNIKVYVLLDEYGSKDLSKEDKQLLINAGVEILAYNPVNFFHFGKSLKRDHRKLLVIDGTVSFVGGAGITDDFNSEDKNNYWHDIMLKINGDIAVDLSHSFFDIWQKRKRFTYTKPLQNNTSTIDERNKSRVIISSGAERNEIIRTMINHIRSSRKRVWLTSPYFISSWKIRRALRYAAKKGVDVRLIFPGKISDHKWVTYGIQRYYQRLLKSNIAIYEYQPRFSHAKIVLSDDWFTVGSSNFDRWNQFLNLDLNVESFDPIARNEIISLFKSDFSNSQLIVLRKWINRPLIQHAKEWFAGVLIIILGFISRKFKR